jgi:hypothetical protein
VPDDLAVLEIGITTLPDDWRLQEGLTQTRGDDWNARLATPLLKVPSAIMPIADSPDLNIVSNHRHPDASRIRIRAAEPFQLEVRLF